LPHTKSATPVIIIIEDRRSILQPLKSQQLHQLARATSQIRNLELENASSFLVIDTASRDQTSKANEHDPPKNESTEFGAADPYNACPF